MQQSKWHKGDKLLYYSNFWSLIKDQYDFGFWILDFGLQFIRYSLPTVVYFGLQVIRYPLPAVV